MEDLERSYDALREAEASRDALSNMIVHDLNTPLSVIQMNAEMLALKLSMGAPDKESLMNSVSKMSDASETLSRLLQGILDVARFESGQMSVRLALVDLDTVARDSAEAFVYQADERGLRIEVAESTGGASVFADDSLLRRMVQNLVSNALKYASGGTVVKISVESRESGAAILVSDDGPGIPEDALDRVFEKHYQGRPEGGHVRHFGVGLGLAFCKLAADAQGAGLTVDSELGQGTTFTISFG
jgi:signal transduction histidine kinase